MKKTLLLLSAFALVLAFGTAYAADDHFVTVLDPGSAVYDIGPYGAPTDGLSVAARGMGVWAPDKDEFVTVINLGAGPGLEGITGSAAGGMSKDEDNFVTIISDSPITFDSLP